METFKREVKSLRAELDQVHANNPYYVGGDDDKVDDDAVRHQQRGHDWTTVDDQSKVSFTHPNVSQFAFILRNVPSFAINVTRNASS